MQPSTCREHVERLLAEEAALLAQLETLLDREHELLLANEIEALEQAGKARQDCVGKLLHIEDERRSLCRMMNLPSGLPGVEQLLRWCDPTHALQRRWLDCAERASRCRHLNDRNGALVSARLKKVSGLLGILTGRAGEPGIYRKHGMFSLPEREPRILVSV